MKYLKEKILEEYKNGNIVFAHGLGTETAKLNEFINQPVDGLLYDLNRSEEVVLTFIDDPKWINDYAVCKVIRALKAENERLRGEVDRFKERFKGETLYKRKNK